MRTKWKDIEGYRTNGMTMGKTQLHIIYTKDDLGETLSVGDSFIQFTMAFEDVMKLVNTVRRSQKK